MPYINHAWKAKRWAGLFVLYGAALAAGAQSPPPSVPLQQPIRVEISNHADPEPPWAKWVSLVEKIAWPMVASIGLFIFRKPLSNFLEVVGKRATEISIGSLASIKLPTMSEAQFGDEVLTFRSTDAVTVVNDSAKRTLFNMFQSQDDFEFVVIHLGRGQEWLSSRLYIFALMLQRMKRLKCVVFVAAGPSTGKEFIGITTPERIRWNLSRYQPWLEAAYVQAQFGLAIEIQDEYGKITADTAEAIVRNFLSNISVPAPPPGSSPLDWVQLGANPQWEHSTWLSREYLESTLRICSLERHDRH